MPAACTCDAVKGKWQGPRVNAQSVLPVVLKQVHQQVLMLLPLRSCALLLMLTLVPLLLPLLVLLVLQLP